MKIVRLPNAGLGNVLYAAMTELSDNTEKKIILCGFSRFHLGPYLRKEKNKRSYYKYFKRNIVQEYLLLFLFFIVKKIKLLSFFGITTQEGKFPYPNDLKMVLSDVSTKVEIVRFFRLSLLKESYIKYWDTAEVLSTSIHMRRGDFKIANMAKDIGYYTSLFERANLSEQDEAVIFTDEVDELVRDVLLRYPNFKIFVGNEIESFLMVGKTRKLLITSGSSFGVMSWIVNGKIAQVYG